MADGRFILLVDDDVVLRRTLAMQLQDQDDIATVTEAASGGEAICAATSSPVPLDLILLDLGLPDMDGRDVCRQLRAGGVRCPIIMLTSLDSEYDTVTGLEAGANDYVTKPFRMAVLLARLRAHMRQHRQSDDAVFAVGPYRFVPASKMLEEASGRKIRLTEKEAAILKYLYRQGRAVDRETLLHEVWGYNAAVSTHTLETHIYRLRQKIEPVSGETTLLLTEEGGYRLSP
ncbi:response regulator transcription factor [Haematospirillum jordaniae]|uniref:Two-component system response regulator n=1 Tax=Haematospirillum jordaniae TaxID=1549855 RepID=A0A143DCE9_9PROT|nr:MULTISPECIES: response regulator transcription factor [Haematospirillum]AMW34404.1 two-component system response regulator [Haematospirillum jordaniae]NKD44621.1 response regulator transcription factor [Haematospirillum jordaniae]NKD57641.1 response regulator transcription factor [Haematospirillum jordaniae]NKD59211.1 response regulator transcription factor [Haematospirillum jordaniae]NKD67349.1 response regulator transcription factor [Haematospirillum jordaniae]